MTLTLGLKPGDRVTVLFGKYKGWRGKIRRKYFYADPVRSEWQYKVKLGMRGIKTYPAHYLALEVN